MMKTGEPETGGLVAEGDFASKRLNTVKNAHRGPAG
jgi:hypothetical protein